MRLAILPLAFVLAAAAPASAQPAHWTVDSAKSRLSFSVQWSGEAFSATFKAWRADILFDPTDLAHSRATVAIDLGSESSEFPENDEGLKGADGTLTLHGITKRVSLPFTLVINGKQAHMTGRTTLLRPDFGLAGGEFAGDTPIGHAVTVNVDLTATRP